MIAFAKPRLNELIALLHKEGYEVLGPRVEEGTIAYGPVGSVEDLPVGWSDIQGPGTYRLEKGDPNTYFGFAVGPHSWKRYLFPPKTTLWQAKRTESGVEFVPQTDENRRLAFLGVRGCELSAIGVQDRVFLHRENGFADPHYAEARDNVFVVAVECQHPAATCFCVSMGTGPGIGPEPVDSQRIPLPLTSASETGAEDSAKYDLLLTELEGVFVARAGSQAGEKLLTQMEGEPASRVQLYDATERVERAAERMTRTVAKEEVPHWLRQNQEHSHWADVANRCLSCANCTLVCPTCFCSSVHDRTDLGGGKAERVREWDCCFNPEFAYVHGGNFRPSIRGRYRQWLTHKFASWVDQFGVSGCVGCGRCITWCPVGIDVTEELQAFRLQESER